MRGMSLRSLLGGSAMVLVALALVVALGLIGITSLMGTNTAVMWHSMESVYAAEQIEIALLRHGRERRLLELTGDEQHAALMKEQEQELWRWMAKARDLVGSPEEAAVLDEVMEETAAYLEGVAARRAQGTTGTAVDAQPLHQALPTARQLVEINLADADRALAQTQSWDDVANALGVGGATLLLAGILASIWLVRREVYEPLVAIQQALVGFQLGTSRVVSPVAGARELREIAGEFNRMSQRLEQQREIQLAFIAGVAHDLRNPLSVLKLSTALIEPGQPLPTEDKVRVCFSRITRQLVQLERMVEDLLDTTQIEAGHLALQLGVHDLVALVGGAVDLHEGVSEKHRVVFQPPADGPALVRCDSTRLAQVLNNLLGNAIKYSPVGGEVRVETTTTADTVRVAVADSGIGIPPADLESVFEPFRRSSNTKGTIPGVGLGLAVARKIIAAHGGRIHVESRLGAGASFWFTLPRVAGDEAPRRAPRVDPEPRPPT